MARILIVEDNANVREALALLLSLQEHVVEQVAEPDAAMRRVHRGGVDLVIQDMNFSRDMTSGIEGVELFHAMREVDPQLPIIVITAWAQLETAVDLVKAGAADYMAKPWDDDKLIISVNNLLALRSARRENLRHVVTRSAARQELAGHYDLCGLIYESEQMHEVVAVACRVAAADVPVLITGPSGAGKEKLAEILQRNSRVADGPFVRVNVGALPPELIAAELFGAEPGAYTGLNRVREGRFEAADGGTLFLDEIGTLPLDGQVQLLRVLQTGEFQRLGSDKTRKVSVRVISATNAQLQDAIRTGRFRDDLYYRLNVVELVVPSLAERPDDIAPLARSFLDQDHSFAPAALQALQACAWPGNVRELENCVRRACLLAGGQQIDVGDLHLTDGVRLQAAATEPDRDEIARLLARHKGVIAAVARDLGLSRQALYRRMDKLGLRDLPDA